MREFSIRRSLFRFPQLLFNYNSKANQIKDCFAEDITLSIITAKENKYQTLIYRVSQLKKPKILDNDIVKVRLFWEIIQ